MPILTKELVYWNKRITISRLTKILSKISPKNTFKTAEIISNLI